MAWRARYGLAARCGSCGLHGDEREVVDLGDVGQGVQVRRCCGVAGGHRGVEASLAGGRLGGSLLGFSLLAMATPATDRM